MNGLIEQSFLSKSSGTHNFLINYQTWTSALASNTDGYYFGIYRVGSSPYSQFSLDFNGTGNYNCDVIFTGY